jgi:hypothetical protein
MSDAIFQNSLHSVDADVSRELRRLEAGNSRTLTVNMPAGADLVIAGRKQIGIYTYRRRVNTAID